MFAFLTSLIELLGLIIKSFIKPCFSHAAEESNRQNPERSDHSVRERGPVPKKSRRASITEKTVSSTERTIIYELGSSGSSSPQALEETPKISY